MDIKEDDHPMLQLPRRRIGPTRSGSEFATQLSFQDMDKGTLQDRNVAPPCPRNGVAHSLLLNYEERPR
eukprot:12937303-Prorocentrum_lima.AAC.1